MRRLRVFDIFGHTYTGGWPFDLQDIDYLDKTFREALKLFLDTFTPVADRGIILSGCEIDFIAGTYNPGVIYCFGEICQVDGGTLPVLGAGQFYYWNMATSYDSDGLKQFENGSSVDTYLVNKGVILAGTPAAPYFVPINCKRLYEVIAENTVGNSTFATKKQEPWHFVGDTGQPAFENSWGDYNVLSFGRARFMIDQFGFVVISGAVTGGTIGSTTPIFRLPPAYRPEFDESFIVPADNLTTNNDAFLRMIIYKDGRVSITSGTAVAFYGEGNFVGIPNLRFRALV